MTHRKLSNRSDLPMPKGFTLVELLVVIVIIGLLVALLVPAVQAAREAARKGQCMNNLKQMALGAQQHESARGIFPTGGWGYSWAGDADRGFTKKQPGGWIYNILPYIGEQVLHDLGLGMSCGTESSVTMTSNGLPPPVVDKQTALATLVSMPLTIMNCPSRRRSVTYPMGASSPNLAYCENLGAIVKGVNPTGLPTFISLVARSDYAASCGSAAYYTTSGGTLPAQYAGPATLTSGDSPTYAWHTPLNGVCYERSEIKSASITDGTSNTIFCGEKYMDTDNYAIGSPASDNESMYMGFGTEIYRSTNLPPQRDTMGYDDLGALFGSAHYNAAHFAMCDGSVRRINYNVNPQIFQWLGCRNDGRSIDPTQL